MVRGLKAVRRLALVPLVAWLAAGCGAAPPVPIPSISPSPAASPTTIAPGVQVPTTEVKVPTYTVSTSHPLPSGVSAATVAQDVVIDNLIENLAIERGDATLLTYADCGNWLAAEKQEILKNSASGIQVLSLTDRLESVSVGFQPDPANPDVVAAATVTGTETRTTQQEGKPPQTSRSQFDAILWFGRPPAAQRYLVCDAGT